MQTIEYRTKNKADWGGGEWDAEPDKKQWLDQATGLPCLIVRNHGGALCGYVGVGPSHPFYEKDYEGPDVRAHGCLTFAGHCQEGGDESQHICHVSDDPTPVWWLGFDCAHSGDLCPAYDKSRGWETYGNFAYVTREVESLARQLKDMETKDA